MKITINLATRPFADIGPMLKRLRIAMAALAVVSVGLGLGLYFLHNKAEQARARDHSLDGDIARVTQERKSYESLMRQPDNALLLSEAANLNRLFDEKSFSWTLGMEDLETVLPGGVQVTTLEPLRDKHGLITLRLRVVGPRDKAVALVQNLEHSRHFLLPRIVTESSESNGMPGEHLEPVSTSNKVNFDVLADYNPSAPREVKAAAAKSKAEDGGSSERHTSAKPAVPAHPALNPHPAGPGLRRPPLAGVSKPPQPITKPRAGEPQ